VGVAAAAGAIGHAVGDAVGAGAHAVGDAVGAEADRLRRLQLQRAAAAQDREEAIMKQQVRLAANNLTEQQLTPIAEGWITGTLLLTSLIAGSTMRGT